MMSSANNCNSNAGSNMPTTGPMSLGYTPLRAGVYFIKAQGEMVPTVCNFDKFTGYAYTTYYSNPEEDFGCTTCTNAGTASTNSGGGGSTANGTTTVSAYNGASGGNTSVGEPVNVINGNMYLDQTDFALPGLGAGLQITRAYNSLSSRIGTFGESWTSNLEAQALTAGPDHFFLRWGDGSGTFFKRASNNEYLPLTRRHWFAYGLKLADDTYQVYAKGGLIYQFNGAGNLVAIKDRNNNQTTITRHATNQRIEQVTDAEGRSVTFNYASATETTRVRSLSNSNGTIATYTYAGVSLYDVTYADASKYRFVFTAVRNRNGIGEVRDFYGNVLEKHEYYPDGKAKTSELHGGVEKFTLTYVNDTTTEVRDAYNRLTTYTIERNRHRPVVTEIAGQCACGGGGGNQSRSWTYTFGAYDSRGLPAGVTDPRSNVTTFAYTPEGRLWKVTDALGKLTTFEYYLLGKLKKVINARGYVTIYTYNSIGRTKTVSEPAVDGNGLAVTTFTYDKAGRLEKVTDPRGYDTTYTYDGAYRLLTEKNALNAVTTYGYDLMSNLTKITDALGRVTDIEYDDFIG